jgi:hypothetical protein
MVDFRYETQFTITGNGFGSGAVLFGNAAFKMKAIKPWRDNQITFTAVSTLDGAPSFVTGISVVRTDKVNKRTICSPPTHRARNIDHASTLSFLWPVLDKSPRRPKCSHAPQRAGAETGQMRQARVMFAQMLSTAVEIGL